MKIKNFQMYKLGFKEAEEPEIKLPTFTGSWRKQGSSRKTSISTSLTVLKSLTIWITINCGKFYKRWESQTTLSVSLETCMRIKKQHLELNMEKLTASKLGKECDKVVYCHSAYLIICRVHFCIEMLGWNQDCREIYNNVRYADDTILNGRK